MLGLFGTLNLGARSLLTQQKGIEVAGHNLANVNNPAYARQRVSIVTGPSMATDHGVEGSGADAVAIIRLRSAILDDHIADEVSVRGSLEAQQEALQTAQAALGQQIDRRASGAEGSAAALGVGGQHGVSEGLTDLFNSFQSLSTDPTSLVERQVLMMKAQDLAVQMNSTDRRLANLTGAINSEIATEVGDVNTLLADIAKLNENIGRIEVRGEGIANDLRDARQQKIEELTKIIKIDATENSTGAVDISIGGNALVSGPQVLDTLETYDAGGGQILVRTVTGGANLTPTAGSIHGSIEARDGAISQLRSELNTLASTLITQVNAVHAGGFSLTGSTGAAFFTGTNAGDIGVNSALVSNPALVQASGVSGAVGDNQNALALARLSTAAHAALGNQTFSQSFGQTVSGFGQSLSSVNMQLVDQEVVESMLKSQRDSISGVSLDEEMTDLTRYQKAYAASAKLITTVDEMLDIVMSLKR